MTTKPGDPDGPVLTGDDLGFQRTVKAPYDTGANAPGYFVIKVNGRWQRVGSAPPFAR